MTLTDWGTVAGIAVAVATVISLVGHAISQRLGHIDACLDRARADLIVHQEKVETQMHADEATTRNALAAHVMDEGLHLARIDRNVAYIAGMLKIPLSSE